MTVKFFNKNIVNDAIIKNIAESVNGLRYGTVIITVNDSKIVQVEITQKNRFDDAWAVQEGGGI